MPPPLLPGRLSPRAHPTQPDFPLEPSAPAPAPAPADLNSDRPEWSGPVTSQAVHIPPLARGGPRNPPRLPPPGPDLARLHPPPSGPSYPPRSSGQEPPYSLHPWPTTPSQSYTPQLPPRSYLAPRHSIGGGYSPHHPVSRPSVRPARQERQLPPASFQVRAPFHRPSQQYELEPPASPHALVAPTQWASSAPFGLAASTPAPPTQDTEESAVYRPDSPNRPPPLRRTFSSTCYPVTRWASIVSERGPGAAGPSTLPAEDYPARSERSSSTSSRAGPSREAEQRGCQDKFLPLTRLLNPFPRASGSGAPEEPDAPTTAPSHGSARLDSFSSASAGKAGSAASQVSGVKRQAVRRRQFKYLTDRPPPQQAKESVQLKEVSESRKKVKRACVYCRRSHMPCCPLRPCARCVKRGIAHLCKDDLPAGEAQGSLPRRRSSPGGAMATLAPVPAQGAAELDPPVGTPFGRLGGLTAAQPEPMAGAPFSARPFALPIWREAPAGRWSPTGTSPTRALSIPISLVTRMGAAEPNFLPHDDAGEGERLLYEASMDAMHVCKLLACDAAVLTESALDATIVPSETSTYDIPLQNLLRDNAPLRRILHSPHSVMMEEALTLVALHADRHDGIGPWGYGQVAIWLQDGFDEDTRQAFDHILGSLRLRFLQRSLYLSEQQLQTSLQSFHASLAHYRRHLFETVPHAMALISRTGVVFAGNQRMCNLLQLTPSTIFSGQVLYFDLVARPDALRVLESYASAVDSILHSPWAPVQANLGTASGGATTLTHDFIVDRQALLHDTRAWNHQIMDYYPGADQELDDGSPTVVHFRGLVTMQLVSDDTGIPSFIAVYTVLV